MIQSWSLIGSGVLILALGLFHSIAGEKYLVRRLLKRDNLPHLFGDDSFTKLTIRYAWHVTTIACAGFAAVLFYVARDPSAGYAPVAAVLAVTFIACGVWGVMATRGRHLSWIVFIVAGLLAGFGVA